MNYDITKLALSRQLRKHTNHAHGNSQGAVYQIVIDTYLATIGNEFGYDATIDILNDAMAAVPNATFQLNRSKILVKD